MATMIGEIVKYTLETFISDEKGILVGKDIEFPAIIYKIYEDPNFVGLHVFTDTGMRLIRKALYNVEGKTDTWRSIGG